MSFPRYRLLIFVALLTFLAIAPCAFAQQSQGAKSLRLARIEFDGLKRYTREQIIEASGLKVGQTVNETVLDEAANRLLQTGFFKNMNYRVRAKGDQATVTFQVEEKADRGVPVVYDNFVWFTDEELANAIRREIPSYDGTALETGNLTDKIKAILQQLLQEKKIAGQVEYMSSTNESGGNPEHVFSIVGVKIPICELSFTGAAGITADELKENSKSVFNQDYSRRFVVGFANAALRSLYRQRGYLRANFSEAPVKLAADSNCRNGVAVTLVAEEGLQYSWDKALWTDNTVLTGQQLDTAMSMKAGEVASSTKIDKGVQEVEAAYGKQGYINAHLRAVPEFDDANKRVTYRFNIKEGP